MSIAVSVVIPAYNAGKYLGRAIDSVLAQTRPADEIIVVDDGSTDNTADVAHGYGEKIRFIRQENAGASVARNTGIEAATSEWIAFLDADDEWLPRKLKLQTEHLRRNPDLVWTTGNYIRCYCDKNQQQDDLSGERLKNAKAAMGAKEYFDSYFLAHRSFAGGWTGTMLIKKQALVEAGLFLPGQLRINDVDMWFRLAYRRAKIGFIAEPLAVYHMDVPDSIIKTYKDPAVICDFIDRHRALAAEHGIAEEFEPSAGKIMGWWIHCCVLERRGRDVRRLLQKYGHLHSRYYRITTFIKSLFPRTGLCYDKIKRTGLKLLRRFCKFIKNFALYVFLRPNAGYRLFLKKKYHVNQPEGMPKIQWENKVLEKREEWVQASEQVEKLKLPLFSDKQKNWDSLAALSTILKRTNINSNILDAGSELYSMILPWLFLYGYKNLTGINTVFNYPVKRGMVRYRYGDITKTSFTNSSFDAISCLSVIEHGVDLHAYFKEMARILKQDGVLITSTDYFDSPIDTENLNAYGEPIHIFSKSEIIIAIEIAKQYNLELTGPVDLNCNEKAVRWTKHNLEYTFLMLTMQKKR